MTDFDNSLAPPDLVVNQPDWTCPRCGGHYFGMVNGRRECHNATDGGHLYREVFLLAYRDTPPTQADYEAAKQTDAARRPLKPCGWKETP